MTPEPPLEYMLEEPSGSVAGRDELAAIVARSTRRRTRVAAAGMAGTLLVGAVGGWAVANRTHRDKRVVASAAGPASSASPTTTISDGQTAAGGGGIASAVPAPFPIGMKRIFVRTTADGVTVRGFELTQPKPKGAVDSQCLPTFPAFQSEVSTTGMASGFGTPGFDTSGLLSGSVVLIGQPEQSPVWVATTHTATAITLVRVRFSDGTTDQMTPVDGWAGLAHGASAPPAYDVPATATVEGLDQQGKVVATQQLDRGGPKFHPRSGPQPGEPSSPPAPATTFAPPPGCVLPPVGCPPVAKIQCPAATTGGPPATPPATPNTTVPAGGRSTIGPPAT